jgi:hypothetical protein
MLFNNQKQPFSTWDHHKDSNIDKDTIHLFHSISIGHVPLFHFVSYMEILFLISHSHYIIQNLRNKKFHLDVLEFLYINKQISKVYVLKYLEQSKGKCLPTCALEHALKKKTPWVEILSCFSSVVCIPSKQNFKVHLVKGCEGLT